MDRLMLSELAEMLGCPLVGADVLVDAVASDSRKLPRNALFVALRGARFDGHDFLPAAREAGAVAAMVDRPGDWGLPYLLVEDTRRALGQLAAAWRRRLGLPVVAITGSNGKTTTKEMTAAILAHCGPTLSTEGNLNNDIGLPLTLLRLGRVHENVVVEMGASAAGEIAYLAGLAQPNVGVITNAGPAHLQGFGSLEGVARAKGELLQALPPTATAVINADDAFAPLWLGFAGQRRVLDFGIERPAAVRAEQIDGGRFVLCTPKGKAWVRLPLPGRHNVLNALAAAAAALALDASLELIVAGLEKVAAVPGRLLRRQAAHGAWLLDDTYNANPSSLRAGLEVLAAESSERWLVLGDMAELGAQAARLHAEAGQLARRLGVHRLFAVGPLAASAAEQFGSGGEHFENKTDLIARLTELLQPGVTLLVKGSRSSGMEQVVEALLAAQPPRQVSLGN